MSRSLSLTQSKQKTDWPGAAGKAERFPPLKLKLAGTGACDPFEFVIVHPEFPESPWHPLPTRVVTPAQTQFAGVAVGAAAAQVSVTVAVGEVIQVAVQVPVDGAKQAPTTVDPVVGFEG